MNQASITGKLHDILPTEQVTQSFTKRIFVLELEERDPKYNQYVPFELYNGNTDIISAYQPGQMVTVTYNLKGRENGGKYYPSLSAWKIQPFVKQQ